jgi:predicted RNA-binding Zn-ribbon protein involved in translation (DUF1610 family)
MLIDKMQWLNEALVLDACDSCGKVYMWMKTMGFHSYCPACGMLNQRARDAQDKLIELRTDTHANQ